MLDYGAAKLIGAGISVICLWGVGLGLGNIFSSLLAAIARNPSMYNELRASALLGIAFTEAIGLFALSIAFLILFL